jgi:hypothetical protein
MKACPGLWENLHVSDYYLLVFVCDNTWRFQKLYLILKKPRLSFVSAEARRMSKCCQSNEKSTFSASETSTEGPAYHPSMSGYHMAESDILRRGIGAHVTCPTALNSEKARSLAVRPPL